MAEVDYLECWNGIVRYLAETVLKGVVDLYVALESHNLHVDLECL